MELEKLKSKAETRVVLFILDSSISGKKFSLKVQ